MATRGPKLSNLETKALLKEVARRTHLTDEAVRLVFDNLLDVTREALKKSHRVIYRGFGSFRARKTNGHYAGVSIRFKPALDFKKDIKEAMQPMEKYAVELKEEAVLLAQVTNACPDCKAELTKKDPPQCPNCGTAPFENKDGK